MSPRQYFLRPQLGWSWAAIPYKSCYCHKKILRGAVAGFCVSSSILLETPNRGGIGQLSPIKAVIVTRSSCAEQSQVFVSPRQYFLRLPTGVELGSNPPIKAVIVTRSSCAEQSQVIVSPRQYFLRPQLGWSWAAIPYKSCYCHKKLLRGAVAGYCISSSKLLETPNRGGVGQHRQCLTLAGHALLLCRRSSASKSIYGHLENGFSFGAASKSNISSSSDSI